MAVAQLLSCLVFTVTSYFFQQVLCSMTKHDSFSVCYTKLSIYFAFESAEGDKHCPKMSLLSYVLLESLRESLIQCIMFIDLFLLLLLLQLASLFHVITVIHIYNK